VQEREQHNKSLFNKIETEEQATPVFQQPLNSVSKQKQRLNIFGSLGERKNPRRETFVLEPPAGATPSHFAGSFRSEEESTMSTPGFGAGQSLHENRPKMISKLKQHPVSYLPSVEEVHSGEHAMTLS
jgi:hypothetical protein